MRDYHGDAPANPGGFGAGRRRRRPVGEPPTLPRRIGKTGWWCVSLGWNNLDGLGLISR
jgi:hypothetical protein